MPVMRRSTMSSSSATMSASSSRSWRSLALFTTTTLLVMLGLMPLDVAATDGWHMDYINPLVTERLDSIVSPGGVASHMHRIIGGDAMSANYDYDRQMQSTCTTVGMSIDKSNYWLPQLYWFDNKTTDGSTQFVPIPAHVRWYYFLPRDSPNTPNVAFPPGFRMLSGDPNNKDLDVVNYYATYTCRTTESGPRTTGTSFNFDTDCPYGLITDLHFPNCWDGVNLYAADGSHVAFSLNGVQAGHCPASHPYRIPSIMLEYTWSPSQWAPGVPTKGHLAWANGDTTGGGLHGDFQNGWDVDILTEALNAPGCINTTGEAIPIQQCPVLAPYFTSNPPSCTPTAGVLQEPYGNNDLIPIPSLPGCNPLWGNTPTKPTDCTPEKPLTLSSSMTGSQSGLTLPADQQLNATKMTNVTGWTAYQCLVNEVTAPPLVNATSFNYGPMTIEICTAQCAKSGLNWAGVDYAGGWRCTCGSDLNPNSWIAPGQCSEACPGDSTELCGATYRMAVYYNNPDTLNHKPTSNLTVSQAYLGCSPNNQIQSLSIYNYSSSTLTNDNCAAACVNAGASWSATWNYQYCYCGVSYDFESRLYVPDSVCNLPCRGNSSQFCGSTSTFSVTNLTATSLKPTKVNAPPGRIGCYQDFSRKALTGYYYSSSTSMTVESCQATCLDLNATYAGLESGNGCFCGDTLATGPLLPDYLCSSPCTGNSSETCGANQVIELYTPSAGPVTTDTMSASHPSGWQGCFSNSPAQVGNYSYSSNTMSVEVCKAACTQFKYTYAWLTAGNQCNCANTVPTASRVPYTQSCTRMCPGNSTESCGGSTAFDLYTSSDIVAADPAANRPQGWVGCYKTTAFNTSAFALSSSSTTIQSCQASCKELSYTYAGLGLGSVCYCSSGAPSSSGVLPVSGCTTSCSGNSTQICGGSGALSIYSSAPGVVGPAQPSGWVGCYNDPSSQLLPSYSYSSSSFMSSAICKQTCGNQGYKYAGTRAGQTCQCGNSISSGQLYPRSTCSTPCTGDANEMCGSSNQIDVYTSTTSTNGTTTTPGSGTNTTAGAANGLLGCFSDSSAVRTFSFTSSLMSPDVCSRACAARNYAYAGLMNGNWCGCSNTSPLQSLPSSVCSTACAGGAAGTCGGPNVVQAYQISKTGAKGLLPSPGANGYLGCWTDSSTSRMLGAYFWSASTMTQQVCAQQCNSLGYSLFGVEYGSQCFCDNAANVTSSAKQVTDSTCNMACQGNANQTCGAGGVIQMYQTSLYPGNQVSKPPGFVGCYPQSSTNTVLTRSLGTMSSTLCRRVCANSGYSTAGVNGNRCYCWPSDSAVTGQSVPPSQCSTPCTEDPSESCGASSFTGVWKSAGATYSFPRQASGYIGCYQDGSPRILTGFSLTSTGTTGEACQSICQSKGFSLAGTENGNQCFCGNSVGTAQQIADSSCTSVCAGNSTQICGAGGRMSLYNANGRVAIAALPASTTSSSSSTMATASKSSAVTSSATTTTKSAITSSATSTKASSSATSSKASSSATSSKASSSATSSKASSSTLTTASATTTAKTSSVATTARSSSVAASSTKASSSSSAAATTSRSTTLNGQQTLIASVPTSAKTTTATSSSSTKPASSSASSTKPASSSASSTKPASSSASSTKPASSSASSTKPASSSSSSSSTKAASSTVSMGPRATSALLSSSGYVGCYTTKTMADSTQFCSSLTPGMCRLWCNANGYALAAVSAGNTCGCADTATGLTAATTCNTPCSGDGTQTCGGSQAMALYQASTGTSSTSTTTRRKRRQGSQQYTAEFGAVRRNF